MLRGWGFTNLSQIQEAVDKVLKWFEEQPQADAEEHEAKQKELEVGVGTAEVLL